MVDRRDPIWRVLGGGEVTAGDDRMYSVVIPTKRSPTQTVIHITKRGETPVDGVSRVGCLVRNSHRTLEISTRRELGKR